MEGKEGAGEAGHSLALRAGRTGSILRRTGWDGEEAAPKPHAVRVSLPDDVSSMRLTDPDPRSCAVT